MNMPTISYLRLLVWLLAATLAVSALFTAFPQIDIAVSALFYRGSFWLYEIPAFKTLRFGLLLFMFAFAFWVLGAFLWALIRRRPLRALGYSVAVILTGPLLLVNTVLKDNWGRARPIDITVFGGDKLFTPAYLFSNQCDVNCSFTSGEGGAIATVAILIAFLAWPNLTTKGRRWLAGALAVLVVVTAGLRVAMGQHFLSDTLLSILFCALVAAGLYRLFYPNTTDEYRVGFQRATARHPGLGYQVNLALPLAAKHRPAVRAVLNGKYHEAFSHRSFKKILGYRPGNVVHAGAFFGDMLHTLSKNAVTVYAFEPVLDNYVLAKTNMATLGLQNVMLFNAGLAAKTGQAQMQTYTDTGQFRGGASSVLRKKPANPEQAEPVSLLALDDLRLGNISLLHLDVEGFELEALTGATQLIAKEKPVILLEDNAKNCADLLKTLGYRFCFYHGTLNYWAPPEDSAFVTGLKPA